MMQLNLFNDYLSRKVDEQVQRNKLTNYKKTNTKLQVQQASKPGLLPHKIKSALKTMKEATKSRIVNFLLMSFVQSVKES